MNAIRVYLLVTITLALMASPALARDGGAVTGMVLAGGNNAAVPDAVVTLWEVDSEGSNIAIAPIPNNPQYTSNLSSTVVGVYTFFDVPYGTYNITVDKGGRSFFARVYVTSGTTTANIVLPEYNETATLSETSPEPSVYYTYVPVTIATTSPGPAALESPGFDGITLIIALGMLSILVTPGKRSL